MRTCGLPPIEGKKARVLILGSMPGAESLRLKQYYAHQRNAMWRILEPWAGASADYGQRCETLIESGIALWDVIESCRRKGSLDTAIRDSEPNDLARFAARHPELRRVLFNGKKARQVFDTFVSAGDRRLLLPDTILLETMPSTSPANTDSAKVPVWRTALGRLL